MKIISAAPTFIAPVPGRPPQIEGAVETRYPAKTRIITRGEVMDLTDPEARAVLDRFGKAGVVRVGDRPAEDALLDAKAIRAQFCYDQLRVYREQQDERRASGLGVSLPNQHHRNWRREYEALRKELGEDELLTGDMPGLTPQAGKDPIQQEMAAFGLAEDRRVENRQDALTRLQQDDPGF